MELSTLILTPEQKKAVESDSSRILCLAGAGSGKTRVLIERITRLIRQGKARPSEILAITFTRKAASEMKERLSINLGNQIAGHVNINTFHAIGLKMLKEFGFVIGYGKNISIFDEIDRQDVLRGIMNNLNIKCSKTTLADEIQKFGATGNLPEKDNELYPVFCTYISTMREWKCLCYSMILSETRRMLQNKKAWNFYHNKWKYIFIDEFQDTDRIQYNLHSLLDPDNLFAVGDDYQCWHENSMINTEFGKISIKELENKKHGKAETIIKKQLGFASAYCFKTKYGDMLEIATKSGKKTRVTYDHKFFATEPDMSRGYYLYLMYRSDMGYRIGIMSGGKNATIQYRTKSERAEKLWLLKYSENQSEIRTQERILSLEYGIPTIPYCHNGRGIQVTQKDIDLIFNEFGQNGLKFLKSQMPNSIHYPHFIPKGTTRHNVSRSPVYILSNYSDKNQFLVSHECNGKRIRHVFNGELAYSNAYNCARYIADNENAEICEKLCIEKEKLMLHTADSLFVSQKVPVKKNKDIILDPIVSIKPIGIHKSYHVSIPATSLCCADDIISHNSIYGFRYADIRIILGFEDEYPNAERILLNQNFRSTTQIVDAGCRLIANNKNQIKKKLFSTRGGKPIEHLRSPHVVVENKNISDKIKEMVATGNYNYKDFAILYRNHSVADPLVDVLDQAEIPFNRVTPSQKFWQREEIRGVLSIISCAINFNDFYNTEKAVNFPFERIEPIKMANLKRKARQREQSLWKTIASSLDFVDNDIGYWIDNIIKLRKFIENVEYTAYDILLKTIELFKPQKQYENKMLTTRIENIDTLIKKCYEWTNEQIEQDENNSINSFIEWAKILNLELQNQIDEEKNEVTLCTVHAAKGLEWRCVIVAQAIEGVFPSKRGSIEEERRLFYVAATRAKENLFVYSSEQRQCFYKTITSKPSRFISEMNVER